MSPRRVLILGAAGRDFHNFNTVFRDDPTQRVAAFTATQIPKIEGRRYPPALAGEHYPEGIPILPETDLERLIDDHAIDDVVFAYSDVPYDHVGHLASRAIAAGASFRLLGLAETTLDSPKPVVAVTATRTGCGKSPTSRYLVRALKAQGHTVAVVRHPMPYGDLAKQAVQRFASRSDLDLHRCTFEEREEYESHIDEGTVLYAGIDFAAILEQAAGEADIVFWDGGNNDWPFYRPDVWVTVADPLRAGHELTHFPGEVNIRAADVIAINKVNTASPEQIRAAEDAARTLNPNAELVRTRSTVTIDADPSAVTGKRVLCIEDGPTLTHGGMAFGAARVAAEKFGAATVVDPRPTAVGSLRSTLERFPHIDRLLPAMGYYPEQIADLEASIRATDCDTILVGTPFDLAGKLDANAPMVRVRYAIEDTDPQRTLADAVLARLDAIRSPTPAHAAAAH